MASVALRTVPACSSLIWGACEDTKSRAAEGSPAPTPSPAAPQPEPRSPSVQEHMAEHFTSAAKMRDAVIQGDLASLRTQAQWMAEHVLSASLPERWKPHVTALQTAAKDARDAGDIAVAARAVPRRPGLAGAVMRRSEVRALPWAPLPRRAVARGYTCSVTNGPPSACGKR